MNDEDFRKKKLVRDLIENPLFDSVINEIRAELGLLMLDTSEEVKRVEIFSLAKALDRLVGHLTAIANEVRAVDG